MYVCGQYLGYVAIPFRVGWGFSLGFLRDGDSLVPVSQSLSGWDGVFHRDLEQRGGYVVQSQSLSGWDGVFHWQGTSSIAQSLLPRRNPFQGGMGFFTMLGIALSYLSTHVAIPFRVGWGFSRGESVTYWGRKLTSQSLSGWDGVFHLMSRLLMH